MNRWIKTKPSASKETDEIPKLQTPAGFVMHSRTPNPPPSGLTSPWRNHSTRSAPHTTSCCQGTWTRANRPFQHTSESRAHDPRDCRRLWVGLPGVRSQEAPPGRLPCGSINHSLPRIIAAASDHCSLSLRAKLSMALRHCCQAARVPSPPASPCPAQLWRFLRNL